MYYKEFLRVRKIFTGFAICLVALFVLILVFSGHVSGSLSESQGAPRGAVVATAAQTDAGHLPSVGVQVEGGSDKAPIEILFAIAGFAAAIFGMVIGCALASENAGHLEVAWTRPASRVGYALRVTLVDAIGIITMFAFVLALSAALITIKGWWPDIHTDAASVPLAARLFAFPFAWYGLVAALTASLRGGAGLVAGLSWPVASIAIVLEKLHPQSILGKILTVVNAINPLLYVSFSDTESTASSAIRALVSGQVAAVAALACIAVFGVAVSLIQWRRLEA